MNVPTPSDLAYFLEVTKTGNLSRAAERLGITQPSLTLAIQRLEVAVGTKIIHRSKRGVSLTHPGKQLLIHSQGLFQFWEHVQNHALASLSEVWGNYTIGCHVSVALYSLYGFLPQLLKDYPDLHIQLKHDLSRKITESVISSTIDLGIVVNPVHHPDLVIHKLCDDKVTFWKATTPSLLQDLRAKQVTLIYDAELTQAQSLLKQLKEKKIIIDRVITTSSLEVVVDLTAGGCGIGILPTRVATRKQENRIVIVPKMPSFEDEICLLYRVENKNVRSIQTIAERIRQFFREGRSAKKFATSSNLSTGSIFPCNS